MNYRIVKAAKEDFGLIWPIFKEVISTGDTFIYPADIKEEQASSIWMDGTDTFIVYSGDEVAGAFVIRPNKIGRGSHVCNAGFMVASCFRRQGVGRFMGENALRIAKELGYNAMQFNIVVSTNKASIGLWLSLGFEIIGTVPKAFNHQEKGLVDIHIMHRFL